MRQDQFGIKCFRSSRCHVICHNIYLKAASVILGPGTVKSNTTIFLTLLLYLSVNIYCNNFAGVSIDTLTKHYFNNIFDE